MISMAPYYGQTMISLVGKPGVKCLNPVRPEIMCVIFEAIIFPLFPFLIHGLAKEEKIRNPSEHGSDADEKTWRFIFA